VREDIDGFAADVAGLRARAEEAGRDPRTIRIDVVAPNRSLPLFEGLQAAGVERAILRRSAASMRRGAGSMNMRAISCPISLANRRRTFI